MVRYFVVFQTEEDGELPKNDIVEHHREISDYKDIKDIEYKIAFDWFGDNRGVVLINFKKVG
jgi:hypothetical protein